jgi:hypothetical protein
VAVTLKEIVCVVRAVWVVRAATGPGAEIVCDTVAMPEL